MQISSTQLLQNCACALSTKMAVDKWAANLSFLFKEFPPLERFEAASRNGNARWDYISLYI